MPIKKVGRVEISPCRTYIWWEIDSFSILRKEHSQIWSPIINKCKINLWFHNFDIQVPTGSLGLILSSRDFDVPLNKRIRVGLVGLLKSEIYCCEAEWIEMERYFRIQDICTVKSLNEDVRMHFYCEVINKENGQIANFSRKEETACETDAASKAVASKRSTENVSEKCSLSTDEDTKQKLKNLEKFIQNFQELYVSGKHTDVIIKVKDREFKVHKAILAARSSVFDAMFTHGFSESNSGIVPIEDCEPAVFEEFLFFVYTGRLQQLSSENVCDLYYVADKYQISELKEECVSFLKNSMKIEKICDIICLSTKCNETELLNHAINFFARNMEEILVTVKWQLFMEENPTKANELTLKALKLGFVKRKF